MKVDVEFKDDAGQKTTISYPHVTTSYYDDPFVCIVHEGKVFKYPLQRVTRVVECHECGVPKYVGSPDEL